MFRSFTDTFDQLPATATRRQMAGSADAIGLLRLRCQNALVQLGRSPRQIEAARA